MRRTAKSSLGRLKWIESVGCYSCRGRHFPHLQRCSGLSRGRSGPCSVAIFESPRSIAIRRRTESSMPPSLIAKRNQDTTNTARIGTYACSKRRCWSIQTCVQFSTSTAHTLAHAIHTGRRVALRKPRK